ncbi:MAG: ferrous iron transport protein B [Betaproteobacteria bacterium]
MAKPNGTRRRIAFIGMPNTGKSTLFSRLTGVNAKVANWPGMTVDLLSARTILGGRTTEMVDLPGLYSLHGFGEDERLVRHFLEQEPVSLLLVVLNAVQIERQLPLVLQMKALQLPIVVVLNMADEAANQGIHLDVERLSVMLEVPVRLVSAKRGDGIAELKTLLTEKAAAEEQLSVKHDTLLIEDDRLEAEAERIVAAGVDFPHTMPASMTDKLDRVLLHPWLGLPLFVLMMYLLFQAVYGIGLPLQDGLKWLIDLLRNDWLQPALAGVPEVARSFVLEGLVDGVGTVLTFLPIILVFFVLMAVVEDSGYLARIAFLMDRAMSRLGLDGRAFVMQVMGLGCNVPALMGTRVIRSRSQRLLSLLIIPFSLCSARLQVIVFITGAFFPVHMAPLVMMSFYGVSFVIAFITALIWKRRFKSDEAMLLEFPPYRLPTLRSLITQGLFSTRHFLQGASGFILGGVLLIWVLTHYPLDLPPASPGTLAGQLAQWLQPVFSPIGVDSILSVALLFGFVAKEIVLGGLAVIYGAGDDKLAAAMTARLDWVQAYSFMLFIIIYTPCLSSVAAIRRESKSLGFAALSVAWPLMVAWLVSFAFYQTARHLLG